METSNVLKLERTNGKQIGHPLTNGKALIYSSMSAILGEIGAIGKTRRNQQQGYNFRGIDELYNVLNPLLSKHAVFSIPEVLDCKREERNSKQGTLLISVILSVRYTFFASDGSSVACIVIGEAMDSGDKATNKAMSAAQKYAFLQIFAIPTEEPKDSENDSPEVAADLINKQSEMKLKSANESQAVSSQGTDDHEDNGRQFGELVINWGLHRGKQLQDLTEHQINSTIQWCLKNNRNVDFVTQAKKYLDSKDLPF